MQDFVAEIIVFVTVQLSLLYKVQMYTFFLKLTVEKNLGDLGFAGIFKSLSLLVCILTL